MKCSIEGCEREGKERKVRYVWKFTPRSPDEQEMEFRDYGILCEEHYIEALKDHILELLLRIDSLEWDIAEMDEL